MLLSCSGIRRSGSMLCTKPSPLHSGQAPRGLLNENILGSSSSMLTPCSGHARLVLKVFSVSILLPSSALVTTMTCIRPSPWVTASSQASASLLRAPSLTFILSITISMVCLNVFSSFISSSPSSFISPSTLTLVNPSRCILSSIFSC